MSENDRAPRAASAGQRPAPLQGGRHSPRALPGDRGAAPRDPGVGGDSDQAAGRGVSETFTVRKQSFGVGVERTFPLRSAKIERIEVMQIGDVNRAKLYYLRDKVGKKARVRAVQRRDKLSSVDVAEEAVDELRSLPKPSMSPPSVRRCEPAAEAEVEADAAADPKQKKSPGKRLLSFDRGLGVRSCRGRRGRSRLAGGAACRRRCPARLHPRARSPGASARTAERLEAALAGAP